jgi:hypothetical protein
VERQRYGSTLLWQPSSPGSAQLQECLLLPLLLLLLPVLEFLLPSPRQQQLRQQQQQGLCQGCPRQPHQAVQGLWQHWQSTLLLLLLLLPLRVHQLLVLQWGPGRPR